MSTLSFRAKLGPRSARSVTLASSLIAALGVATARAQSVELPQIIVSAGQAPMEASRVGASVTVISGDELREKRHVEQHVERVAAHRDVAAVDIGDVGDAVKCEERDAHRQQDLDKRHLVLEPEKARQLVR